MPNVKIFVDEGIYPGCRDALGEALGPMRQLLCRELKVEVAACQVAVMPVLGMDDLPRVNVEMQLLPQPERTRELIMSVCTAVRALIGEATDRHTAVRVSFLDPQTYVALK